jgi:riboflavin synthase
VFTGIVEELGTVASIEPHAAGARIVIRCTTVLEDAREGSSIAVNGACLTAVALTSESFAADLAPETLTRTNLGDLQTSSRVNLERPVTPVTRLSGHIVQGHVDATGELLALDSLGDGNWWLKLRVPLELDRYLVFKGSITIDGISLTIAGLENEALENHAAGTVVSATIIPHTYQNTTLGAAKPGSLLNIEVDVLAKHLEKLIAVRP